MIFVDEREGIVYAECTECKRILKFRKNVLLQKGNIYKLEEPVECFCENMSDLIESVPSQVNSSNNSAVQVKATEPRDYKPHCPTCGSENVQKISVGAKVIGGTMFGLFSSNVRKSYHCNNCGYKW